MVMWQRNTKYGFNLEHVQVVRYSCHMASYEPSERSAKFSEFLALELKGAILATQNTILETCKKADVDYSTFTRYVNGKRSLPSPLLAQMCEVLGVDPREIVNRAYTRLLNELGPYEPDAPQNPSANVQNPSANVQNPSANVQFLAYPDPDVAPQARAAQTLGDLDNEETGEMDQP